MCFHWVDKFLSWMPMQYLYNLGDSSECLPIIYVSIGMMHSQYCIFFVLCAVSSPNGGHLKYDISKCGRLIFGITEINFKKTIIQQQKRRTNRQQHQKQQRMCNHTYPNYMWEYTKKKNAIRQANLRPTRAHTEKIHTRPHSQKRSHSTKREKKNRNKE